MKTENMIFETIDAIDLRLFNEHITKLLAGEEIKVPRFNFLEGKNNMMELL